ncbi:sodium-dependent transporter [Alkalitalea saponilacus]|nr:sodium-dependent transporter [Alkalitalea saponilacus]
MGVAASFMILSFYAVVAGWTLEYAFFALKNHFAGMTPAELKHTFDYLTGSTWRPVVFMLIFMFITAIIVQSGIKKGIERYTKILMPVLLVIILVLCVRSLTLDGASAGLEFLFKPDFSAITTNTVMMALGQAFFSLSLGMGVMATYGSYIKKRESLGKTAVFVTITDVFIAILAGIAIFPAVFAFGLQPGQESLEGPGLVFMILPGIFNQMAGGYFFSVLFFFLLVIAALTSSISLMEVVVAYFVEELKIKRVKATWIAAGSMSFLSALSAVDGRIFNFFENTSSNILLPLGGLLIVIFVGWFLGKKVVREELEADGRVAFYFRLFVPAIRFLAPIAIAMVFLNALGIIKF